MTTDKIKLANSAAFPIPMPMVLLGAKVDGKANFMPVGWVSRVNPNPPLMMVSINKHHTNIGIEENKAFSINIPDVSLLEKTDYCGIVSGKKVDKSELFDVFYGESDTAPLLTECPVSIALSLYDVVKLPQDTIYIGEVQEIFTEEKYLTEKKIDPKKVNPFSLSMPDNQYWSLGENLGKAWSIGKALK